MTKKSDIFYKDIGIGPYHPSTGTTLKDNPELYMQEEEEIQKLWEEYRKQRDKTIKRRWLKDTLRWLIGWKPILID